MADLNPFAETLGGMKERKRKPENPKETSVAMGKHKQNLNTDNNLSSGLNHVAVR